MIKLKERRKPDDPGDSGSLNDLSFLLIVFFIVIAGFNVNKGFLMDLPDASRPRIVQTADLLKCAISDSGEISLNGEITTMEALTESVLEKKRNNANMTFALTVSPGAEWQRVVDVIHEIRRLEVSNFSFKMGGEQS